MTISAEQSHPIKLFYSYSHEDENLRVKLEKHLTLLKRQGLISEWHDRMIEAGENWKLQIDTHLETSQIILLLVSPDFLASDYCYDVEMKRALELDAKGEARVIPIILRWVDWKSAPFAHLQVLPKDGRPVKNWSDQDQAFENITKGIRRVITGLSAFPATAGVGLQTTGASQGDGPASSAEEGLFLARIINPQKWAAHDIVSTVWLNVRGPVQYFVDSIRIKAVGGGIAGGTGRVAQPPDAEYRFTYADGVNKIG